MKQIGLKKRPNSEGNSAWHCRTKVLFYQYWTQNANIDFDSLYLIVWTNDYSQKNPKRGWSSGNSWCWDWIARWAEETTVEQGGTKSEGNTQFGCIACFDCDLRGGLRVSGIGWAATSVVWSLARKCDAQAMAAGGGGQSLRGLWFLIF